MSEGRIWTPYEIKLLLHLHTTPEPWPLAHTDHYRSTMSRFESIGLIDRTDFPAVTWKGKALVDMWCSQPHPVAIWVDPRGLPDPPKP